MLNSKSEQQGAGAMFSTGNRHISYGTLINLSILLLVLFGVASVMADALPKGFCPVTTNELAEEQYSMEYQGQTIYFCCNNCKRDFLANPEAYLDNLTTSAVDSAHDHSAAGHDPESQALNDATDHNNLDAGQQHDHTTDHGGSISLVSYIGKFHPMLTHFPIALVLSALFFSVLAFVFEVHMYDVISVYSVYLAAATGVVTVLIGLAAGYNATYPSFLTGYFGNHRLLGILTGILTFITAYYGYRYLQSKSKVRMWIYRGALVANSILVGITGHYGAALVFGPDYFDI